MTLIKASLLFSKLVCLVIFLIPTWAIGQLKVGGVDLSGTDVQYLQLSGFDHLDFYAWVDYGQKYDGNSHQIQNAAGKALKFNSSMDALNHVSKNGWELISSFTTYENRKTSTGTGIDYHEVDLGMKHIVHFVLRRKPTR